MQKQLLATLFFTVLTTFVFGQLNMSLLSQIEYDQDCSDIWGYAAPDGREYAIVGLFSGISIVDVTDPANATEVVRIPGQSTTWRDIKTYGEYAYVVADGAGEGVTVIDLRNLPESAPYFHWTPSIEGLGTLLRCHNIYIDEFGYAYLAGCNVNDGGNIFIDVFSTPGTPVYAGAGPSRYAHDVYTRGNLMYSSEIYAGRMAIYDVSDKDNVVELGLQQTPFAFTHNIWLSDDGNTAYTADERANAPVAAYDVSDPTDITELDQFRPLQTLGTDVVPHNVHVWNDWLVISYYTDGGIIVDASRPNNLIEVGNFDTFFSSGAGFNGVWGAYPFLPSGVVLLSDRGGELYVLDANYVRACHLEGQVTDAVTGLSLSGVDVDIETDELNEAVTGFDGTYGTGLAQGGEFQVSFFKPGYEVFTTTTNFENGVVNMLDVQLQPLPRYNRAGLVVAEDDGTPIDEAQIVVENEFDRFEFSSEADGRFAVENIYAGTWNVTASKWGFKVQLLEELVIESNEDIDPIELPRGYKDDFVSDLGWTTSATADVRSGFWELVEPVGTTRFGSYVNPEFDVEGDNGDRCYVTGNGGGSSNSDDVDGGSVLLTSPVMALASTYVDPTISYRPWLYRSGQVQENDVLDVLAMNGLDTVLLTRYTTSSSSWGDAEELILSDYIEITDEMYIQFIAADPDPEGATLEAAIDDFEVLGEFVVSTTDPILDVSWGVAPNPFNNDFRLNYQLATWRGKGLLRVVNTLGQVIEQRELQAEAATLELGANWPKGIYFIQLDLPEQGRATQRVIKQ